MSDITLTEEQKLELEAFEQSELELLKRRARLILAYSSGKATMEAARHAGISRGRARYWKRQFSSRGMSIFSQQVGRNAPEETLLGKIKPLDTEHTAAIESINIVEDIRLGEDELSFPAVQQSIGIETGDSLASAGKKVWLYHFAIMISHEEGALLGEDVEELHDMRVATRRMRTAFDIFGEAFDPKIMERYLKGLRKLGRALGQVRDMDVILENGIKYNKKRDKQEQQGLEALLTAWRNTIDSRRKRLSKHLQSETYRKFKFSFNHFLQQPLDETNSKKQGIEGQLRIRDIVPALIYSNFAKVRAYDAILPTATISQLHALRIEFKKFRYTLEYFREVLGEEASSAINEIKKYQDHLGELHDADVACQLVREFLIKWEENQLSEPIFERLNPESVVTYLAYLHSERYRLMIAFPELWQRFNRPDFRQYLAQAISLL